MANIGEASIRIVADASDIDKDITKKVEKGAEKAGGIGGTILGTTIGVVAGNALTGLGKLVGGAIGAGFQRINSIDQAKKKLEGLGHSAGSVQSVMDSALASVKGTAFGLGDAASQAANFVAAGIKPGEDLTRTLKVMADTATIAGVPMAELGDVFRDTVTSGKLGGKEIARLADRGIPALQMVADHLGITADQAKQMAADGEISFDTFQSAMEKGLGGAALKSGETFEGAMANVQASMGRMGATLLTPLFEAAKDIAPILIDAFDELGEALKPVMEKLGPLIADAFSGIGDFIAGIDWAGIGGAVASVVDGIIEFVNFISDNMSIISTFAVLIGALAIAFGILKAINIVQQAGGIGKWMKATKLATAVQAAFNVVMSANPIVLIVMAIAALVGALIWFFTQTKLGQEIWANFVKFLGDAWTWLWESVLQPVIKFIGDAFTWLYENAIKPAVDFIVGLWQALADAATWLWESVLKPVFDFIGTAFGVLVGIIKIYIDVWVNIFRFVAAVVKWLWENAVQPALKAIGDFFGWLWKTVIKVVVDFIVAAIQVMGDIFTWLWENAIKPVIDFIADAWNWIWESIIKPVIDFIVDYIKMWGRIFQWLYDSVLKPVFDAISKVFDWVWKNVIKPIIGFIVGAIEGWARVFTWLYEEVIKPVWDGIQTTLEKGWDWIDQNVFKPFRDGIDLIQDAFENVAKALPEIWNSIKKAVAEPINFVLDTIWNKGLRSFWNDLVTELDLKDMKLPAAKLISFAKGGIYKGGGMLPGYSPGRDIHQFFSPTGGRLALSGGEGIIRPDALRALGGKKWLDAVNGAKGRNWGDGQGDKHQGFLGDAFAWVADTAQLIGDFLLNPAAAIDKYLVKGIIQDKIGNQNIFGKTIAGLAANTVRAMTSVFDILAPSDGKGGPANAVGWQRMWAMVQAVAPWATLNSAYRSPASNAAAGGVKGSYHTQGRAIDLGPANMKTFAMAKGLFPNARELIYTPAGAAQLLNGQSFSGWSDYVKRIHYNHIHVAMKKGGIFDQGGMLAPGAMGMNLSGKPEAVFSASQFDLIQRSLDQNEQMAQHRGIIVEKGAVQVVGPDPYKTSLMVVDRIAEKVGI